MKECRCIWGLPVARQHAAASKLLEGLLQQRIETQLFDLPLLGALQKHPDKIGSL